MELEPISNASTSLLVVALILIMVNDCPSLGYFIYPTAKFWITVETDQLKNALFFSVLAGILHFQSYHALF